MDWSERCEHIAFGLMKFGGRKMSTRRGQVVFLDEVLDEAVSKAEAIIAGKNPELTDRREIAQAVGIGAVVFGDLKHNRMLEVDFSLDEALRFEGETGPYLQYTAARAHKLLAKRGLTGAEATQGSLEYTAADSSAWECLKTLAAYPDAIRDAVRLGEPSIVARYLLDAAKQFNRFYHQERIITDSEQETQAKLVLVSAALRVLRSGLSMLGLKSPNQI
jgi:arginyl-tRNA synthetase